MQLRFRPGFMTPVMLQLNWILYADAVIAAHSELDAVGSTAIAVETDLQTFTGEGERTMTMTMTHSSKVFQLWSEACPYGQERRAHNP